METIDEWGHIRELLRSTVLLGKVISKQRDDIQVELLLTLIYFISFI